MKNQVSERMNDTSGMEMEEDSNETQAPQEKVKASSFSYNKKKFQLDNSSNKK